MKKMQQLLDEKACLIASVEEINDQANSEGREPTAEELEQIEAVAGSGGKLDQLDRQIAARQSIDRAVSAKALEEASKIKAERDQRKERMETGVSRTLPARAIQHKTLRAYKTPEEAYKAGQWWLATQGHDGAMQFCRDHGITIRAAQGENDPARGGYLVPESMERSIITLREERGVARRYANVVTMPSETHIVPRREGGLTVYFPGEAGSITDSDKEWDQVKLVATKAAVMTKVSSELNADAIVSVIDDLTSEIAYAFADIEDKCLFLGDGTSTYGHMQGLITAIAAGSQYEAASGNTAFSTLDLADFESMVGKLPVYAEAGAAWYISKAGWAASMMNLQNALGGNSIRDVAEGVPPMFMGYPVRFVQVMNSTLTAQTSTDGLCYFGSLAQAAMLGTRGGIQLQTSEDRYFEYDQLAVRGIERFDVNVHERGTATAAGSIIMLTTPSS